MRKMSLICAILVALLLGGMTIPSMCVSAATNGVLNTKGTEKDGVYRLSKMIGEEMGVWEYYWMNTSQEYQPMEYNKETKAWSGVSPATTAIITEKIWHTYSQGYTVARFTCPQSGAVRIGTEAAVALSNVPNAKDGVIFIVMSDGEVLGEQLLVTPDNSSQEFEAVTIDVYEGQEIEFFLYMNINNAGDSTTITPYVEYTEYKEVVVKEKETQSEEKEELTLRTDIEPIEVKDEQFEIQPIPMLIGAMPIIAIGVVGMVVLLKKKGGKRQVE